MRDALQKRLDTVMQYVCVKPPTSGFVPPFSFWTRSANAAGDTAGSFLIPRDTAGIYFSIAIAHTSAGKKRGGGGFAGIREICVNYLSVSPFFAAREGDDVT